MKRLIFCFVAFLLAIVSNAQIEWSRKYATAVVRGHVKNAPGKYSKVITYLYSHPENVVKNYRERQDVFEITDSIGEFSIKCKICWPLEFYVSLCEQRIVLLACPGDTFDIEMDYEKAQKYKNDNRKLYEKAIIIRGGTLQRSPEYMTLGRDLTTMKNSYRPKDLLEQCRNNFTAYREKYWNEFQTNLKTLQSSKLTKDEKAIMECSLEAAYIDAYQSYVGRMSHSGLDSLEKIKAEEDFTLNDPHAASLKSPYTVNSAFYLTPGHLGYLKANGLAELPLGKYLQEREKVADIVARLKAQQDIPSESINSLSEEFQQPLFELKAELAESKVGDVDWKPIGAPGTWLKQIVDRHHGKVVFIDYWATWCGPCNQGIREMEKVKADYEKRGVDFVYITDDTSTTEGFVNLKKTHSGEHFIFTQSNIDDMNIPGYNHSIPHYLLYDRDGNFIKAISGWDGVEEMCQELDSALGDK